MSKANTRLLSELHPSDFVNSPVWEYDRDAVSDEQALYPVHDLPVTDLSNRLVGTRVRLNNGTQHWALLGNVQLLGCRATKHFLTLSIENNGEWFDLARYHDVDFARRGPAKLAEFLNLQADEVFPLLYDISYCAVGSSDVVRGMIEAAPSERLSEAQLIELALD